MMDWFTSVKTIYGWGPQYYSNADVARLWSGEDLQKMNTNK